MNEWGLYRLMAISTLLMLAILLALYIYSLCRVRNGSDLSDVKRINIMLIVSSIAGIVVIGTQF
jgi:uncharacterized membrane protein